MYICVYVYIYVYTYIYIVLYIIWLCIYFRCSAHEALAKFPEQQIKLFHGNISLPGKSRASTATFWRISLHAKDCWQLKHSWYLFHDCVIIATHQWKISRRDISLLAWHQSEECLPRQLTTCHLILRLIHSFGLKTRCGNQTIWATFQWPSFLSNPWHPCKHTLLPCYTSTVWFRTCMRLCSNCRNSKTFWPLWIYLASLHQCWTSPLQFGVSLQQPRFIAFEQ